MVKNYQLNKQNMPRVEKPIVRPLQEGMMTLRELRWSLAQDVDAGIMSREKALEIELEYLDSDLKNLIEGLSKQIIRGDLRIDQAIAIAEGYLECEDELWSEADEIDHQINNKGAM